VDFPLGAFVCLPGIADKPGLRYAGITLIRGEDNSNRKGVLDLDLF